MLVHAATTANHYARRQRIQSMKYPLPNIDADEADRITRTRLAWRIVYGEWLPDLTMRVNNAVGKVRADFWKNYDLSANPAESFAGELAKTYAIPPLVKPPEGGDVVRDALQKSGYWQLCQRLERDAMVLRESVVRIDKTPKGDIITTQVNPQDIHIAVDPKQPRLPVAVWHQKTYTIDGTATLAYEFADVRDPDNPVYATISATSGEDITMSVHGREAIQGAEYPWRIDGDPVVPYVIRHAAETSKAWDYRTNRSLIDGTLNTGVFFSFFGHCLKNNSWKQRYGVNVKPLGVSEENLQSHMVTDPSTVAMFASLEDGTQPMLSQWDSSSDPLNLFEAIERYVRRLASFMGISGADQVRMSGDPRSGYAVSVSRDAQREQVRAIEPMSRQADEQVLAIVAGLLGGPSAGYQITYRGIPLSTDERRAMQAEVFDLIEQGMITRFDGFMRLNPELSEREAAAKFAKIQAESRPNANTTQTTEQPATEQPATTEGTPDAPAPQEVLNGAQVTAALLIMKDVASGLIGKAEGLTALQSFFKLDATTAHRLLANPKPQPKTPEQTSV